PPCALMYCAQTFIPVTMSLTIVPTGPERVPMAPTTTGDPVAGPAAAGVGDGGVAGPEEPAACDRGAGTAGTREAGAGCADAVAWGWPAGVAVGGAGAVATTGAGGSVTTWTPAIPAASRTRASETLVPHPAATRHRQAERATSPERSLPMRPASRLRSVRAVPAGAGRAVAVRGGHPRIRSEDLRLPHRAGRSAEADPPPRQHEDAAGHGECPVDELFHDDEGDALLRKLPQIPEDLLHQIRCEAHRHLVEQDHPGRLNIGTGHRQHLLLPAAQRAGSLSQALLQARERIERQPD